MRVLVAYASKHGSTRGIAEAIVDRLCERSIGAEAASVDQVDDVRDYDVVVLGSAIYAGSWMRSAVDFAERNREALRRVPVWLFSSGPLGTEVKGADEQPKQVSALRDTLHPCGYRLFCGALDRARPSLPEGMIAKAVRAPEGDFRDWDGIGRWVDEIARSFIGSAA